LGRGWRSATKTGKIGTQPNRWPAYTVQCSEEMCMVEVRTLEPHDPLPPAPAVVVMRRFDEDDPRSLMIEMIVSHESGAEETSRPVLDDGTLMDMDQAVEAARARANAAGLDEVYVVDRTAGPREREILSAGGDHSVHMEVLDDMDLEDGEKGPDMRDRR
jgi:hypothetical protein